MTALNVVLRGDEAHVFTDGAGTDASGRLMLIQQKVTYLPHARAVISMRGPQAFLGILTAHLAQGPFTFEGLTDDLPGRCQELIRTAQGALGDVGAPFELALVGWSEARESIEGWVMFSNPMEWATPWTFYGVGSWGRSYTCPGLPDALQWDGSEALESWGRRVVQEQRNMGSAVGAFVQQTTVTRDTISTRIIHRWPDKMGDRLKLATAAEQASFNNQMRKQRW